MSGSTYSYSSKQPLVVIVGGPAGTGKSSVASLLCQALNAPFIEGDERHPPKNIEKMSQGIPLTDEDRWEWLKDIAQVTAKKAQENKDTNVCVGTCSALTVRYRDYLRTNCPEDVDMVVIFLVATEEELLRRVQLRKNHYMQSNMVASQVALMEVPKPEEELCNGGICVPVQTVGVTLEAISKEALESLFKAGLIRQLTLPDM